VDVSTLDLPLLTDGIGGEAKSLYTRKRLEMEERNKRLLIAELEEVDGWLN
jgi:hypothetical protein